MILDVIGVPQLSLLDARILCSEAGIRLGYLTKGLTNFQVFKPKKPVYFGPMRVVYIEDVDIYVRYIDQLYQKKVHHLVLINAAYSTLVEMGIQIYEYGIKPFTGQVLLDSFQLQPVSEGKFLAERKLNLAQSIAETINKESLLGKLQSSFYRIKSVDERDRVQKQVYAYLTGKVKRKPYSGLVFIDNILDTDLCQKVILAVEFAKKAGPDAAAEKFGIDRFEIAYVLRKDGFELK